LYIVIEINMDNAAFIDNPDEVRQILRHATKRIERGAESFNLYDLNGNRVGQVEITED
jgi:hypothetical protein